MWPWRRSPSPDAAPRHAPAGDPAAHAAGGGPPATGAADAGSGARGDWQLLAPIQRVTAEPQLINPVSRFQASLAAWQNPSMLEPLGHRLGADEPSGIIGDIATVRPEPAPVHATGGVAMPLAGGAGAPPARRPAVQRAVAPTYTPFASDDAPVAERVVAAVPVAEPAGEVPLPPLTLPTVGVVRPEAPHRAPAGAGDGSAPAVQRSVAPTLGDDSALVVPQGDAGGAAPAGAAPPTTASTPMPVATPPVAPTVGGPIVMRTPSPDPATPAPATPAPAGAPVSAPPVRRFGLGEPIVGGRTGAPGTPAVQRMPLAQPPAAAGPAAAATPAPPPPPADAPLLGSWSPQVETGTADLDTSGAGPAPAATPVPMPVPVLAPQAVAGYPTLSPAAPRALPVATGPHPVVARLVGDAPPLALPPAPIGAGVVSPGRDAYPAAPGAAGPAPSPTGGGARTPAVPTVGRVVDPAPAVTPPRAAPVPSLVYATGATVPAPGGGPAVQRSAAPGGGGVPLSALPIATASWVNPAVVQRVEVVEAHAPRPVTAQREDAAPAGDSAPSATPVEAASTPPATAHEAGGGDAESLLAKLFDPLLSRLKTELRLDRERRGALTDLWH